MKYHEFSAAGIYGTKNVRKFLVYYKYAIDTKKGLISRNYNFQRKICEIMNQWYSFVRLCILSLMCMCVSLYHWVRPTSINVNVCKSLVE